MSDTCERSEIHKLLCLHPKENSPNLPVPYLRHPRYKCDNASGPVFSLKPHGPEIFKTQLRHSLPPDPRELGRRGWVQGGWGRASESLGTSFEAAVFVTRKFRAKLRTQEAMHSYAHVAASYVALPTRRACHSLAYPWQHFQVQIAPALKIIYEGHLYSRAYYFILLFLLHWRSSNRNDNRSVCIIRLPAGKCRGYDFWRKFSCKRLGNNRYIKRMTGRTHLLLLLL